MTNDQILSFIKTIVTIDSLKSIISALVVLFVGWVLSRGIFHRLNAIMLKSTIDDTVRSFISNIVLWTLRTAFILVAGSMLGLKMTSITAILGALTLAIGLSLKGNIANFADGVVLLSAKPFRSGDYIEAGSVNGVVKQIGFMLTKLQTVDNLTVFVPNSTIVSEAIINYSLNETRRIDLVVGVDYGTDLSKAHQSVLSVCGEMESIHNDPAPEAFWTEFADSSINLRLRVWCTRTEFWKVRSDLIQAIQERFNKDGISIPFPHVTITKKED